MVGKESEVGRLHLDSKRLVFSGKTIKWHVDLGPGIKAEDKSGQLIVRSGKQKAVFDIGDHVAKWVDKILNPPGLMDKLVVKPDSICWLSRGFSKAFRDQIKRRGARICRNVEDCNLAFYFAPSRDALVDAIKLTSSLPDAVNIWMVYPKGVDSITQGDVMQAMRGVGFGPGKTAAFDDDLSSMRYRRQKS